jgi:hypothetical protein
MMNLPETRQDDKKFLLDLKDAINMLVRSHTIEVSDISFYDFVEELPMKN